MKYLFQSVKRRPQLDLRSSLPTLQAARGPHGCLGRDNLEEDAGLELADIPLSAGWAGESF